MMADKTLCPVCEAVLTENMFPEFLHCVECGIGVKKVECRQNKSQVRASFNSGWVKKHYNSLTTKLNALSLAKCIRGLDGVRDILDIGCADGLLVDMLVGKGYNGTGLDFSAEAIDFARANNRGKYLCCEVDEVKREYDLVVMSHLLEHQPNPVKYLRVATCLIKPGGFLLVGVPNLDGYDVGSMWRRESYITLFDRTHTMAFSKKGLILTLEKAGYNVVGVHTKTLGSSSLNRVLVGLYRKLRGNPTIYEKQEIPRTPQDWWHRVYNIIIESFLVRCLCFVPNKLSERGDRGTSLIVLASIR